MEKVLIVAATYNELKTSSIHFNWPRSNFFSNKNYDVLITGVGITATAFALGKYLNSSSYKMIINLGIAGSLDEQLPLGSLVRVNRDTFSDLGAEDGDNFLSLKELGFGEISYNSNFIETNEDLSALLVVDGITVNTVHGNKKSIELLKNRIHASTESMEGAAVFYAAAQYQLPVLQVRGISNYVEPRNRERWEINLAINNLNNWLIKYLTVNL